jgi:hypothetical protein
VIREMPFVGKLIFTGQYPGEVAEKRYKDTLQKLKNAILDTQITECSLNAEEDLGKQLTYEFDIRFLAEAEVSNKKVNRVYIEDVSDDVLYNLRQVDNSIENCKILISEDDYDYCTFRR